MRFSYARAVAGSVFLLAVSHPGWGATACAALKAFSMPGYAVRIERAEDVAPGPMPPAPNAPAGQPQRSLPAHCRVDGVMDERTGRNGKPYAIGFSLALPASWNGRFFFQGGGGLNGVVNPPYGAQYAGDTPALAAGFAVISTDSGHRGTGFDASFFEDQEAALNFLYQAVAKVTVVGKQLVEKRYGKAAHHSYFVGCSTGGREAMMMSQRFPAYFDGIIAGAPATRTGFQYYERLAQDNAEVPVEEWSRLFLVPGMGHCAGGEHTLDRFNMVEAIVNWVEQKRPPERVVATGASMPNESRPLCSYPAYAHYSGTGDRKSAENYSCSK